MEIEHSTEHRMRREEAAAQLRALADELSGSNEVAFLRDGKRFTVDVPAEVTLKLEVEVGGDGNEIEVEITW